MNKTRAPQHAEEHTTWACHARIFAPGTSQVILEPGPTMAGSRPLPRAPKVPLTQEVLAMCAPGAVETELTRAAWTPADHEGYVRLTPVERLGQPEDIAQTVVFLCLPQSDYMTGQILAVDGGFSMAGIQWK